MITTSEIKISVVIEEKALEKGIKAVHNVFELDKLASNKEPTRMEV